MLLKRLVLLFVPIFILTFYSSAQYKWDIGLKTSSFELERFQLEARYHLKSPYTITATLMYGSRYSRDNHLTHVYGDSLIDASNYYHSTTNTGLKFGVQRKLSFLASNVFYAGATIGFGWEQQQNSNYVYTYSVSDSSGNYPYPYYFQDWEELSYTHNMSKTKAISAQLGLTFGMDVPLTKRFSINAEIGMLGHYRQNLDYQTSIITLLPTISGGVRYRFGKRE